MVLPHRIKVIALRVGICFLALYASSGQERRSTIAPRRSGYPAPPTSRIPALLCFPRLPSRERSISTFAMRVSSSRACTPPSSRQTWTALRLVRVAGIVRSLFSSVLDIPSWSQRHPGKAV